MTVFKYFVGVEDERQVRMPRGAQILCVQVQGGEPFIWARVEPDAEWVTRTFRWRGTGHSCDGVGAYVGTIQLLEGRLVFHLFVDPEGSHDL